MKVIGKTSLVIAISCFLILGFSGCSDSPEGKASRLIEESISKALSIVEIEGDYDKALKEIDKALRQGPKAKSAIDAALMVAGNLNYDLADQLQEQLISNIGSVNELTDKISVVGQELSYLQIEKNQLESLMESSDQQIDQLEKLIKGSDDNIGIEKHLQEAEEKLSVLREEQNVFIQEEQQAQDQINIIQEQADDRLRQSQMATGDRKHQLENEYYRFVMDKKEYLVQAQAALDKVKEFESRIAIVEPLVVKLENDLAEVEQNIEAVETSAERSELKRQLSDVGVLIEEKESQLTQFVNGIKQSQEEYGKIQEEIGTRIDEAIKNFDKIKSRHNRDAAALRLADCYYSKALSDTSAMGYYKHLSVRLRAISLGIEELSMTNIGSLESQSSQAAEDYGNMSMEEYDMAIEEYDKLEKLIGGGKDELSCNVTQNYILALYGKTMLAEQLDKYDIVDETLAKADELMEKASQCDPDFPESITARLFKGETNFVPTMEVDSTTYYNQIKDQFDNRSRWKSLKGEEQKEEIKNMLTALGKVNRSRDPEEFDRILGPMKKELETALTRVPGELDMTGAIDPNFF